MYFHMYYKNCKNPVVNHRRFSAATGSPDLVLFGGGYSPLCSDVPWVTVVAGWVDFLGKCDVNFIKNINHHLVKFLKSTLDISSEKRHPESP